MLATGGLATHAIIVRYFHNGKQLGVAGGGNDGSTFRDVPLDGLVFALSCLG
jgi:hypothetical protein